MSVREAVDVEQRVERGATWWKGSAVYRKMPGLRLDMQPESYAYRDNGCAVARSCLRCPLPRCKYDDPNERRREARDRRDGEMLAVRRRERLTVSELAVRVWGERADGVSRGAAGAGGGVGRGEAAGGVGGGGGGTTTPIVKGCACMGPSPEWPTRLDEIKNFHLEARTGPVVSPSSDASNEGHPVWL